MSGKSLKYVCMILFCALTVFLICNTSAASVPEIKTSEELDKILAVEVNKGKVVVLNFFSTQHIVSGELEPDIFSIMQIRVLVSLYEKYKDRGLEILGFSYEKNGKELLPGFIEDNGIEYPIYVTNKDTKDAYGVVGRPTILICNKEGNIFEYRPRGLVPETVLERVIVKLLEQ